MKGRYAEAEHYGREALKVRPDSVGALQNLAVALIGQGRLDEAEAFLNQAISLQPDKPVLHRIMNSLREHAGRDK
jgi:Flp pilus assembly protein TadD